jgi:hypothetical protein
MTTTSRDTPSSVLRWALDRFLAWDTNSYPT